jgi:DNA-binding MarR family transcriptional regulator
LANIYEVKSFDPNHSVAHLMGRVRVELLAALDRELSADPQLSELGVTSAQFVVMVRLVGNENRGNESRKSASDLCKELSYDAGAMTRMIDRLEKKGLVRRMRCMKDRRLIYLEATALGRAAYPRMLEMSVAVQNRFLRGLDKAQVEQLTNVLNRMLQNVG